MPYIVTTKRRIMHPREGVDATFVSRRAVATLEEATAGAERIVRGWRDDAGTRKAWDAAYAPLHAISKVTEQGGTVGPLPDGTVIEVEPTTKQALFDALGVADQRPLPTWPLPTVGMVIAAYNAKQGEC